MFKCKEKIASPIFHIFFTPKPKNNHNIRSKEKLKKYFYRKKHIQFNIDYRGPHLWNELSHDNFSKLESLTPLCKKIRDFNTSKFSNFKLTHYVPVFPFFTLRKYHFFGSYKKRTRRVHGPTQN